MWMFSRAVNVNRLLENNLDLNIFLSCQIDNIIIFSEASNGVSLKSMHKCLQNHRIMNILLTFIHMLIVRYT